jgi:hypothetical protein
LKLILQLRFRQLSKELLKCQLLLKKHMSKDKLFPKKQNKLSLYKFLKGKRYLMNHIKIIISRMLKILHTLGITLSISSITSKLLLTIMVTKNNNPTYQVNIQLIIMYSLNIMKRRSIIKSLIITNTTANKFKLKSFPNRNLLQLVTSQLINMWNITVITHQQSIIKKDQLMKLNR